jgi:tetratricopeptide (TPR) repeat protein
MRSFIEKRLALLLSIVLLCCANAVCAQTDALMQAEAAYSSGDYEAAEPLYVQAVEAYGDLRDEDYTRALERLANCVYMSGQLSRSVDLFRSVIKLDEQLHGPESLRVADDLYGLTRPLRRLNRFDDAEAVIRRTLQLRAKALGPETRPVAMSWMDLAVNYQRQGRLQDAESAFLSSIAIREKLDDPAFSSIAYLWYSKLLELEHRLPESYKFLLKSDELRAKQFDNPPPAD